MYPVFGIFLTGLFIRYIVKDDISHGVTKILYAISRRQSRLKRHNTWSSVIASAITCLLYTSTEYVRIKLCLINHHHLEDQISRAIPQAVTDFLGDVYKRQLISHSVTITFTPAAANASILASN